MGKLRDKIHEILIEEDYDDEIAEEFDSKKEITNFFKKENYTEDMIKYANRLTLSGSITGLEGLMTFLSFGDIEQKDFCFISLVATVISGAASVKNYLSYKDAKEDFEFQEEQLEKEDCNSKIIKFPKNK